MIDLSSMSKDAKAEYETFCFAKPWAGKYMGLIIYWDDECLSYGSIVSFEKVNLFLHHLRLSDRSLGAQVLIDVLVDIGMERKKAEEEVAACRKYFSVDWVRFRTVDTATQKQLSADWMLRVSRIPLHTRPGHWTNRLFDP